MRKGLTLTLMAAAIASMSIQARAMAPVIEDIPSPIVGNAETVTVGGKFVYLDAIDLNQMATDDVTAPANLMWTYTGVGLNYLINGVAPISMSADPTSPTAAQIINRNDLDPVTGRDTSKATITIRNKALSPLPTGTPPTAPADVVPGTTGIVGGQTQVVTFYCSDGNAYSSQTVFFYTTNTGFDELSGGDPFKLVKPVDKIPTMWATSEWSPGGTNFITRKQETAGAGVCLNGTLTGENYGSVATPYQYFNIAANQVYRFKMKMLGTQVAGINAPLWDIVLENIDGGTNGKNLYIMDTLVFANEGGANGLTSAGSTFTWYWTPPAVATPQWNAGAFTSTVDAQNDPRLRFRMMDNDSVNGSSSNTKSGSICIQEVEVAAASIARAQVVQTQVNITSFAKSSATVAGNSKFVSLLGATATFSGGTVVVAAPVVAAQQLEVADILPTTDDTIPADPANAAFIDEYPIVWKTGKILRMQVGLSAPTQADADHPWDAIVLMFGSPSNELLSDQYQTSSLGIGSPKVGTPQTYTAFYSTGNETKSGVANYHRLRWNIRFINTQTANFPSGTTADALNTGSVKVHSVKVDEVIFK